MRNPEAELMLIGSVLFNPRFVIQCGMWRQAAKVTVPGQPFEEVWQTLDLNRGLQEYRRIFPERTRMWSALIAFTMTTGFLCLVAGIFVIFR